MKELMKMLMVFVMVCTVSFVLTDQGYALKTNKIARKHYILGDKYYDQKRMIDAIEEWEMALELDHNLKKSIDQKIERANYYLKHGVLMENQPEKELLFEPTPTYEIDQSIKEKEPPTKQKLSRILQIERVGGRVSKIILDIGKKQEIRPGYDGLIAEPNGSPVAVFRVQQVDNDKSLAEVISLSRDISDAAVAVVNVPK